MEQNKTIKAGGKEYNLYAVKGYVASVNKIVKTHVYGGGGNQSVSSSNTVDSNIFLIDSEGKEQSFQLSGWDITCREGNELTIAWVLPKGVSPSNIDKRKYVFIDNHSTDIYWNDIDKLCLTGFPKVSKAIIGISFLFGALVGFFNTHSIMEAIGGGIFLGIVFALLSLIPSFIIGVINNFIKSKFSNEPKRVESEVLKSIKEIIYGESSTSGIASALTKEKEEVAGSSKKKIVTVVLVSCLLLVGYWGLTHGAGDLFQTQKVSSSPSTFIPSQTSTQPFIQTSIVSQDSIQKTIDSLEFVSIPEGEFDMGSPSNEAGRFDNEGPVHHVKISKAFYMSKYEVTQKQWRDVMGRSLNGDNLPVEAVSWNDVQNFIKKLNDKEGGNKYRLPTEAEWEYAARAGTKTRYTFGDDESILIDYAWYKSNSEITTHDVGQKKPNPWGLYDMYGNVAEWVQDKYHGNYSGAPTDGSSWESGSGSDRVVRGGQYLMYGSSCRSAIRLDIKPEGNMGIGFRLLRVS